MVKRDFIEDCNKVFNKHPYRNECGFILGGNDWRVANDLFDTLPLGIEEYKLDITALAILSRLYQEGVEHKIVPKKELFKVEWL